MRLDDLVHTTLGRYQIEAVIGQGGMAAVYRAFDPALQRHVALKVLYPQYLSDTDLVERFRREAVTAARLDHPHIAPIYDVGEAGGLVYLALKLLPGPSLADRLQHEGRLPPAEVVTLAVDIAAALDEAHRQGVVHRDIKPGNVLFDSHMRAVLTDFGIAKSLDAPGLTASSVIIGTPDYIAPEQIDPSLAPGRQLDGRADIYAFGALLYRTLTGRRPFEGSGQAVLLAHLRDDPPPPSSIIPSLPVAVDTILKAAMAKNPTDRPSHAGDVAANLQAALGDVTEVGSVFPPAALRQEPHLRQTTAAPVVAAAPVSPPAAPSLPVRPGGRHWRTTFVALATLLLFVIFATALALWLGNRPGSALANTPTATASGHPITPSPTWTLTPVVPTPTGSVTSAPRSSLPAAITATGAVTPPTAAPSPTFVPTTVVVVSVPSAVPPTPRPNTPLPSATVMPAPRPPTARPRPTLAVVPTPVPPTAVPATPTPAPLACALPLRGGFGNLWTTNSQVRSALGCPLDVESTAPAAEQLFQSGMMYWLAATQRIYVMTPVGAGTWSAYPNTYRDGEQLVPLTVPPGCVDSVRGFGKLWRNQLAVSDALGCAILPEVALSGATPGVYQRFQGGTLLYSWAVNGHGRQIYVLLRSGTYATYPDLP